MTVIRVGTAEVYVDEEGRPVPAFLGVVWAANAECKRRGIDVLFGEPELVSDAYYTREKYAHADIVHVNGEAARRADPTVRIVAKDDVGDDILGTVWEPMRHRVSLWRYAHTIPGVDREALARFAYLDPETETEKRAAWGDR